MKKDEKQKEKQLNFGLKNNPTNIYYKYKDQYELWLAGLETKRFLKDPLLWFCLLISLSFLFTQGYTLLKTEMPSKIPILNYYVNHKERLLSTNSMYLFPLLGIIILILGTILSKTYYHKERELSKILMIVILLTNLSLCLIFLRLFLTF
jgi:hypothetical protein